MRSIAAFAIMIIAITANAQSGEKAKESNRPNVRSEYDRSKDQTVVTINPERVSTMVTGEFFMSAQAVYPGKKVSEKVQCVFWLIAHTDDGKLLRGDTTLRVVIDGEKISYGKMEQADSADTAEGVREILVIKLTRAQFEKLANASQVEMQVGSLEFKFRKSELADLKAFVALIKP